MWSVIVNQTGCLPSTEPLEFDTLEDAKLHVEIESANHLEELQEEDDSWERYPTEAGVVMSCNDPHKLDWHYEIWEDDTPQLYENGDVVYCAECGEPILNQEETVASFGLYHKRCEKKQT